MFERKFNGFGYSAFVFSNQKSVDNYLNIMSLVSVDLHSETKFLQFSVDAYSEKTLLAYVFK